MPSTEAPPPAAADTLPALQAVVTRATRLYPDVPPLPTAELARLLSPSPPPTDAGGGAPRLLLVDVRTAAERAVSTLPTALSAADFGALPPAALAHTTVVPYCTVGARSGAWARRLLRSPTAAAAPGLTVRNGEGILLWAHGGGALVAPGGGRDADADANGGRGRPSPCGTRRLHAFTDHYAALLPPGLDVVVFGVCASVAHVVPAGLRVVWQLLRGEARGSGSLPGREAVASPAVA